jgi:hypothetical protein
MEISTVYQMIPSRVREVIMDAQGLAEYSQPVPGAEDQVYFRSVPAES